MGSSGDIVERIRRLAGVSRRLEPEGGERSVVRDAVVAYFESNGYELIEKYLKVDKINFYFRPKPTE